MRRKWSEEGGVHEKAVMLNQRVHKVLHCCNSVKSAPSVRCGTTWNRDVNAAKNLCMLLDCWVKGQPRPAPFCRSSVDNKRTASPEASGSTILRSDSPCEGALAASRPRVILAAFSGRDTK